MGLEAAAIAYVQMENGEYRYPDGAYRCFNDEGELIPNKRELMRRAGYSPGSLDHCDEYLFSQDEFWELVELHRLRRTDPGFRVENEHTLWRSIGGEALRNLYERVFYHPHSLSPEQYIKIVKLILDAGVTMNKMGVGDGPSKTATLLGSIPKEKREEILSGYKNTLIKEMEELESIEKAEKGLKVEEEIIGS